MDNNYVYIVAGLPDIVLDFKNSNLSYEDVANGIKQFVSPEDIKIIELCEEGFDQEKLTPLFYQEIESSRNNFLRFYYTFDRNIRNTQVAYLAKKSGVKYDAFIVGESDNEYEEYKSVETILSNSNILEREHLLDCLRWDKVNVLSTFDYFNLNKILAFLIKLNIVDRWNRLDEASGRELFKKLVDDVRGTFKGIEFE